jgi:hypothetical protein
LVPRDPHARAGLRAEVDADRGVDVPERARRYLDVRYERVAHDDERAVCY